MNKAAREAWNSFLFSPTQQSRHNKSKLFRGHNTTQHTGEKAFIKHLNLASMTLSFFCLFFSKGERLILAICISRWRAIDESRAQRVYLVWLPGGWWVLGLWALFRRKEGRAPRLSRFNNLAGLRLSMDGGKYFSNSSIVLLANNESSDSVSGFPLYADTHIFSINVEWKHEKAARHCHPFHSKCFAFSKKIRLDSSLSSSHIPCLLRNVKG